MSAFSDRLTAALSDRYRVERELGAGGMEREHAAKSRGSADVAEATSGPPRGWMMRAAPGRFSDISRAVASATSTR